MRILITLLLVSFSSVRAEELPSDRRWTLEMIAPARDHHQLRQKYLDDPSVSPDIKEAIEQGTVIVGMCPLEAVAAAGLPLHAATHQPGSTRRGSEQFPGHIAAQCDRPEKKTTVQLQFRNDTQFGPGELFRVCFWEGRVVAVDQKEFIPPCWEEIEPAMQLTAVSFAIHV